MLKKFLLGLACVFVMVDCLTVSADAQAVPVASFQERQALVKILQTDGINGLVMVSGPGNHPFVLENRVTRNPHRVIEQDRLVPMASFQKLITGVCIQQLITHHQLALNTPLSRYFPQVRNSRQVTIQRLMTHRSGLQAGQKTSIQAPLMTERAQQRYTLAGLRSTGVFKWHYSDLDFMTLAAVISRVTGQSYQCYVENHLLKGADLHHGMAFYDQIKSLNQVTLPFNRQVTRRQLLTTLSKEYGAGEMLTTPMAYWRFVTRVLLANPHLLNSFTSQQTTGAESYYGGIYIKRSMIHANGCLAGYTCTFFTNYRTHQTLMFFSNNLSYNGLKEVSSALYHSYFGGYWY